MKMLLSSLVSLVAVVTSVAATGQAQVVSMTTTTFQQGTGGYSGATDRQINMTAGTPSPTRASVDGSNNGDTTESQYFITFGSIFGGSAGQIPLGATILDTSLRVVTGTSTNDNSNSGYFLFSGMRTAFSSGTSITQFGTGTGALGTNGPTPGCSLATATPPLRAGHSSR